MKNLDEIYVFTYVAQLESFSKAGKVLAMPVSTVSRKVSDLETRLGINLILRTTRKLSLTKQGLEFYERCAEHIRGLEEAEGRITQSLSEPAGVLKITVPVVLRQGPFIDFISKFLIRNPQIHIDLLITNQYLDLVSERIDLAIRFGELKDSSIIAKRLGASRQLLVASPQYLKKMGTPLEPKDLRNHRCVLFGGYKDSLEWNLTNEKNKLKVMVSGSISGSDYYSVNEFAIRGHGIALLPEVYSQEAFKKGKLINILPHWGSSLIPVQAVYLNRKFMPARLKLFLKELSMWKNANWS
jgi:DNA-binding transcriptional LysR family regulator